MVTTSPCFRALSLLCVLSAVPSRSFPFEYRRSWIDPITESSSDNVECFLDYMELWLLRRQMDGLLLWLSRAMRYPVSLSSLDRSNRLLSRCRYFLETDSDGNVLFRVHYSACNVQMEKGFHVLQIHLVKKTPLVNGRSDRYTMKCPAMTAALGRERVRCEPDYVQVSRPMPLRYSKDQTHWFLSFRGELVTSVEDASLIGMEVEITNSSVTVRGLRGHLLMKTEERMETETDVLPLWLAHGFYAYSLEASCPLVSQHPAAEVTLHIPKQRIGLVKRGSYSTNFLTLKNIVPPQSISVTVTENKHFVVINIPANEVLKTQECFTTVGSTLGVQAFYSIDLVLEFVEMAYPMNWTMENYYECVVAPSHIIQLEHTIAEVFPKDRLEFSINITATGKSTEEEIVSPNITEIRIHTEPVSPHSLIDFGLSSLANKVSARGKYPVTPAPTLEESAQSSVPGEFSQSDTTNSGELLETDIVGSGEVLDTDISGSGELPETLTPAAHSQVRTKTQKTGSGPTPESYFGFAASRNRQKIWSLLTTNQPTFITKKPRTTLRELVNLHKILPSLSNETQYSTSKPELVASTSDTSDKQKMKVQLLLQSTEHSSEMVASSPLQVSEQNKVTFSHSSLEGGYILTTTSKTLGEGITNQISTESQMVTFSTVTEHAASEGDRHSPLSYSPAAKLHTTSKSLEPLNSESQNSDVIIISSSSHWPNNDTAPWKRLPVDTESEFLVETSRDGFISFVPSNSPPRRKTEIGSVFVKLGKVDSKKQIKAGMVLAQEQGRATGQTHNATENGQSISLSRDSVTLQYLSESNNSRSSSSDWDLLYNPPSSDKVSPSSTMSTGSSYWPIRSQWSDSHWEEIINSPLEGLEKIAAGEQLLLSATYKAENAKQEKITPNNTFQASQQHSMSNETKETIRAP
ncbi:hypothetical protein FKM82_014202 [Ascaphus truei]